MHRINPEFPITPQPDGFPTQKLHFPTQEVFQHQAFTSNKTGSVQTAYLPLDTVPQEIPHPNFQPSNSKFFLSSNSPASFSKPITMFNNSGNQFNAEKGKQNLSIKKTFNILNFFNKLSNFEAKMKIFDCLSITCYCYKYTQE